MFTIMPRKASSAVATIDQVYEVDAETWADRLDGQEQKFVLEWLKCMSIPTAAVRAGYASSVANTIAYMWIRKTNPTKPWLRAAIDYWQRSRAQEEIVSADMIIRRMKSLAFSDVRSVATFRSHRIEDEEPGEDGIVRVATSNTVEIRDSETLDDDAAGAIKSVKQDKDGNISIEMHSPVPALAMLAKFVGLDQGVRLPPAGGGGTDAEGGPSDPKQAADAWQNMLSED